MNADSVLTLLQAVQLVALAPCLFVIVFLLILCRDRSLAVVPVIYFIALASSFVILLLQDMDFYRQNDLLRGSLMFVRSLLPAMSFLLIMQFLLGRIPSLMYWLVLLIPILGGSTLIYATLVVDHPCIVNDWCVSSDDVRSLYAIFSSLLIFLLLFAIFLRSKPTIEKDDRTRTHKYWLVITLVLMNLVLPALNLARLAGKVQTGDVLLIETVIRIAFIYLVLTSLFRVFDRSFQFDLSRVALPKLYVASKEDEAIALRITDMLAKDKLYQEMGFNRENLAGRLEISEHQLSRIINGNFKKSFTELVNSYRIEEAKQRLKMEEKTSVTAIAFEVGFSSIASFNRVFKELVGCSPTEFRVQA